MGVTNLGYPPAPAAGYPPSNYPLSGHGPDIYRAPSPSPSPYHGAPEPAIISPFLRAASPNPMGVSGVQWVHAYPSGEARKKEEDEVGRGEQEKRDYEEREKQQSDNVVPPARLPQVRCPVHFEFVFMI